ncbi:MAG TPA: hypothetical protein PLD20_05060 [Blastocatellia bacterium]|nr:hypothetical protein [Blastocatellia bacterium]HMV85465.1 hypothetical protein [Blastocatellia bacterium]HMX30003.1 hypothetical protein [Blastocatellia bacterium]HMZ17278.1 hypothetical protein [Blastocatellia bacterium]HNG33339.1 hypothetical protein [Blastocatellia bacterium]
MTISISNGKDGLKGHRPGWELPIHQLLVKHKVSAVFHGHDHLFAKEELDGIVYQEVSQPGHPPRLRFQDDCYNSPRLRRSAM